MDIKITTNVPVDPYVFAMENTHEEMLEFIKAVDIAEADYDFTENLILSLARSLSGDLKEEPETKKQLIDSFIKALN